jgi:hypothetical protein
MRNAVGIISMPGKFKNRLVGHMHVEIWICICFIPYHLFLASNMS